MTFGYNANAAFGKTNGEIVDHANGLLSSLIDRREENDVRFRYCLILANAALSYCLGATQSYRIHWAFARRNSDKPGDCYAYNLFKCGCLILHDLIAPSG